MKLFKRIAITVCAIVFVIALVPASSFAVDPVSAATMANALAQAITAYGASQGVSMTYDVTDTDGIGEGVRDLWEQFKQDVNDNDVPTYDSLAVTVWSSLFTKVNNHVGINLDDTSVSYLDAFWNWLLTGPAEMQKVDDQYYAWNIDQAGQVQPIVVNNSLPSYTLNGIPAGYLSAGSTVTFSGTYNNQVQSLSYTNSGNVALLYYFLTLDNQRNNLVFFSDSVGSVSINVPGYSGNYSVAGSDRGATFYYATIGRYISFNTPSATNYAPLFSAGIGNSTFYPDQIYGNIPANFLNDVVSTSDSVSIRPYIGDAVPQDVYIPDNEDVNYAPLPYIGELDIPWDDSLFGDGSGSLSDAQSQAITDDLSAAIEQDSTLTLAADDPIVNPPSEVYIPLLPVTLPSFNFSFSGIWHYVVTWVGSLGSWLTLMFSVWNSLPYAIVIPVYASAVVVIIIGTLKRFL